jgi:hypothetical protein
MDIVGRHHDEANELQVLPHQDHPRNVESQSGQMKRREDGFVCACWVATTNTRGRDVQLGVDEKFD